MSVKKIYAVLLIIVLMALFSSLLCLVYEVPCLLMFRFGGAGRMQAVVQNLRSLKFIFKAGEVMLFGVFMLLRLAAAGLLFRLCSLLAGRFLVPFYLRFYRGMFCLLFFLPVLALYAWVLFPGVNFFWLTAAALALPAVLIFLFIAVFREIRKTGRTGQDLDMDWLVNKQKPVS